MVISLTSVVGIGTERQEAALSLRNRSPLVLRYEAQLFMLYYQQLPSGKWLRFIGRIFRLLISPLQFDALKGIPWAIGFISSVRKLEWLNYNTSTWQTHRQSRCHNRCRANVLRRTSIIIIIIVNLIITKIKTNTILSTIYFVFVTVYEKHRMQSPLMMLLTMQ